MLGKPGNLYIVSTPIGNLADISERAVSVLSNVDLIAAEDTRHSQHLLAQFGIDKPLTSLHEHNESAKSMRLIERLLGGEQIALISDAGTPLINDPGFRLVDLAHQHQIQVVPVPGVSAVMAALSVAGISAADYRFIGFLPAKASARREKLTQLSAIQSTLVLFESPHRIAQSIKDCKEILGAERLACYCRELTKKFETVYRAPLKQIEQFINNDENQRRGEIVLVVSTGDHQQNAQNQVEVSQLMKLLLTHVSIKDAAKIVAQCSELSKKQAYQLGLSLQEK